MPLFVPLPAAVNYGRLMITRCLTAILVSAALQAVSTAPSIAADPNLLARCWPATALPASDGERKPRRHDARRDPAIPAIQLPAASSIPRALRGAVRRVKLPPGKKLVALTLDMCEQRGEISGYDGPVIDALRANGVRATIFAGGKWMLSHPERAQQILADPRLEIGNHGWAHRNVRGLSGHDLLQEILGPQAAFQSIRAELSQRACVAGSDHTLQPRLALYRFPFGACRAEALDALADNGMLAIQWDVSTGDSSKAETAKGIVAALLNEVKPGSIVLAHANGRGYRTAEALAIAIPKLKARGYDFVTVSELLAAGEPVISPTCYDRRPGDTDRYDNLFASRLRPAPPPAAHKDATRVRSPFSE